MSMQDDPSMIKLIKVSDDTMINNNVRAGVRFRKKLEFG